MKRAALFCLFSFASIATLPSCAGELHLVRSAPRPSPTSTPRVTPTQPPLQQSHFKEVFRYGQASGVSQLGLVLYPKKTLREVNETLMRSIPFLVRNLSSESGAKSEVRVGVLRDVQGGQGSGSSGPWFYPLDLGLSPLTWGAPATRFLIEGLGGFHYEKVEPEKESSNFLDSILEAVIALRARDRLNLKFLESKEFLTPVWLHFLYFRDRDQEVDLESTKDEKDLNRIFQETWKRFRNELNSGLFSSTRVSITLVTHWSPEASCLPETRLSLKLRMALRGEGVSWIELCDFMDRPERLLSEFVQRLSQEERRMILLRRPKADSLRVTLPDGSLTSQFQFDPSKNEITFLESSSGPSLVRLGEEIKVEYDAE